MINDNTVEKLMKLSRLSFESDKLENMKEDLQNIVKFIDKLSTVEIKNLETKISKFDMKIEDNFRKDEVKKSVLAKDALENAPEKYENQFVVPKII